MQKFSRAFLIIALFFCLVNLGLATTYYVATAGGGGDNAHNGLYSTDQGGSNGPWLTLTYGATHIAAGDTVQIRGGTYQEASTWSVNGTEANPITITNYPTETVIIDGNNWTIPASDTGNLLGIEGNWYTVSNLEIRYSKGYGLNFYPAGSDGHGTADNIYAYHNWSWGIIGGGYGLINNCRAWNNSIMNENYIMPGGGWGGGITICRDVQAYGIIRGCTAWDNWGEGISTFETEYITIEDCISYNNQINFYISDTKYCLFQRNLSYYTPDNMIEDYYPQACIFMGDEKGGSYASTGNTVINNFALYGQRNLAVGNNADGLFICYNTFVNASSLLGSESANVYFYSTAHTNSIFKNNIILQEDSVDICHWESSGVTFGYNCWYTSLPPVACRGTGDINTNPNVAKTPPSGAGTLTANYFKILGTSPAIGKGLYMASVLTDYFQTVRKTGTSPNGPDIGGYEYITGGGPPPVYYVDSSITDTYVGSATPDFTTYNHLTFETTGGSDWVYKTIADINACTFSPDDFIYFRKGQTWRETLTVPSSGTSGHPITFGAFGSGDKPKIYGSDQITGWTVYSGNIWQATTTINPNESIFFVNTDGSIKWGTKQANADACDAEYEFFSNGTTMYCYAATDPDSRYTSIEAPTRAYCINATGRSYITIDGLDIRHFTDYGVKIWTDTTYNTVQNCHISHGGESVSGAGQGIIIRGSYHQIIDNTIHDCIIHGIRTSTASGKTTSNLTISENEVYDCYHTLIDLSNGNATGVSSGHKVTRNFLHTTSDYAFPLLGCEGIYVASSAATQEDIEVSDNVIINIFCAAIQIDDTCNNVNIFNNTCYGTNPLNTTLWTTGIALSADGLSGIVVKNNIAMDFYCAALPGSSCCFSAGDSTAITAADYNCWYQSTGTRYFTIVDSEGYTGSEFEEYKSDTTFEEHGKWEDPKFVNAGGTTAVDYKLQSISPCINTGVNVGLTVDYFGNAVPYNTIQDIGAHEYQGTGGESEINITDGTNAVLDGGTFAFGSKIRGTNTDQIFTLDNLGDMDLTLSGTPVITITGTNADQFSVQAQPTTPIAASAHVHFTLRFTPTSPGGKVAAISIGNNDNDENPYDINLTGTGLAITRYANTNADAGGDGTTQLLTGATCAWDTIADVNAATFLPGDSVLFAKGCTWRERLLVPSSGSAGHPITFGAYGTGDKPIINGSIIYSGFTAFQPYISWTAEGETVVLDKASAGEGGKGFNADVRVFVGQGSWVAGGNYTVTAMEVGFWYEWGTFSQNLVAEIYNMSGTSLGTLVDTSDPILVTGVGTYKFIGMSAAIVNGNSYGLVVRRQDSSYDATNCLSGYVDTTGDTWSGNWMTWNADKTRGTNWATYEMGVKLYQGGVSPYYATYTEDPSAIYFDDVLLEENVVSKASLTTGQWWNDTVNSRIYLYDNPAGHSVEASDFWNVSYGTAPKQVFFGGTLLAKNTTSKASLATGEWYDDTVGLKIYLYDDPTGHTIEGSYNTMCVHTNNKSYLTIQDLELTKPNADCVWINTSNGAFDDLVVQRCTVTYAYNFGIGAGGSGYSTTGMGISTGLQILNNEVSNNGFAGGADGNTGFSINISGNSPTDYIEDVLVKGNICTNNFGGIKADWFSNDIIFELNYVASAGTAFACDGGQDITWRYNIIDDAYCNQAGYAFAVYRWEGIPGPPYGFAVDNLQILNNTVYGYKNCVSLKDDEIDTIVKNNIFYSNFSDNTLIWMEGGETREGLDINYNCYYTGVNAPVFNIYGVASYNFAQWQALGNDVNSVNADPKFVSIVTPDFSLQAGSPCINAGVDVGLTEDYAGNPIRGLPDIGAYEYQHRKEGIIKRVKKSVIIPVIKWAI